MTKIKGNEFYLEIFEDFLFRHGAYSEYFHNKNCEPEEVLNLISGAFVWSDTDEGNSFWLRINKSWENVWK